MVYLHSLKIPPTEYILITKWRIIKSSKITSLVVWQIKVTCHMIGGNKNAISWLWYSTKGIAWIESTGEGISYPLQSSWAPLAAQLVKNPPAMWETWVWSLGWGDPLDKRKATHSSIVAWRIPCTVQFMGLQRVGHNWATSTSLHFNPKKASDKPGDILWSN